MLPILSTDSGASRNSSHGPRRRIPPKAQVSLLFLSVVLAAYLFQTGHPTWGEGLIVGAGMATVHHLSWTMIIDSLVPTPKLFHRRFIQGMALKVLFVYVPVVWVVGEPPMLGLFAIVGFTGVLLASTLRHARAKMLSPSAFFVIVGILSVATSPLFAAAPSQRRLDGLSDRIALGKIAIKNRSLLPGLAGDSRKVSQEETDKTSGPSAANVNRRARDKDEKRHVELPTIGQWAKALFPDSPIARILANPHVERAVWTIFVTLFVAFVIAWVVRHAAFHPGRLQAAMELSLQWIVELLSMILPEKEARQFLPYIGGLFVYILVVNLSGLIPFAAPGTTFISMTAGLAVCTFLIVQYMAFTKLGPLGYLYHLAGEPKDLTTWVMSPLLLMLHLIEEVTKPVTLAVRLFGNVFAEHTLLAVMAVLGVGALSFIHSPVGLPFELPFMFLALLTGSIQALVFAVLTAVYIALVLPHED